MSWLLVGILQALLIANGIQKERRAGRWSWSKFFFALGFAALETAILVIPLTEVDAHSRYFAPVVTLAGVVAAANFIWFIIACRRWRLPDGRTSLEADRGDRRKDPG
jgi:hypothetical protein